MAQPTLMVGKRATSRMAVRISDKDSSDARTETRFSHLAPAAQSLSENVDPAFDLVGHRADETADERAISTAPLQTKPQTRPNPKGTIESPSPLGSYLRQMGAVPLLTREQEVEIAKRIKAAEKERLATLVESPSAIQELIRLGDQLREGKLRLNGLNNSFDDHLDADMSRADRAVEQFAAILAG